MAPVADTEAASLAACVAHVLGVDRSEVPGEGEVGLRHWLAGRNLGLVPVASPERFEWPGRFLGRRRGSSTWAVFFGAPPGAVRIRRGRADRAPCRGRRPQDGCGLCGGCRGQRAGGRPLRARGRDFLQPGGTRLRSHPGGGRGPGGPGRRRRTGARRGAAEPRREGHRVGRPYRQALPGRGGRSSASASGAASRARTSNGSRARGCCAAWRTATGCAPTCSPTGR